MPHISPDDFRVDGESKSFQLGLGLLVGLLLLLAWWGGLHYWWITALGVGAAAFYMWANQGRMLGGSALVSEKQFPEIHALAKQAASRLTMKMPELFVVHSPELNAAATGFLGRKSIVLNSALIEAMTPEELQFIIGHELAHIKCGHTNLLVVTSANNAVSIPVVSNVLAGMFRLWSRKCEYTCDRGGLLACRNEKAAVSALCKLAVGPDLFKKLDIEHFLAQHMDIEQDDVSRLSESLGTHPYLIKRVKAIVDFEQSPTFAKLAAAAQ